MGLAPIGKTDFEVHAMSSAVRSRLLILAPNLRLRRRNNKRYAAVFNIKVLVADSDSIVPDAAITKMHQSRRGKRAKLT